MPISGHRRSEAGKQEGALARPAAAFLSASLTPQGGHFLATIDTCVAAPPRVAALRRNRWPKSPESATITYDKQSIIVNGVGRVSAQDVLFYDEQGHIVWEAASGSWLGSTARSS